MKSRCSAFFQILSTLAIGYFAASVTFADRIHTRDGRIIENIRIQQELDDLFIFVQDGTPQSIHKSRIMRVEDKTGKVLYEYANLRAQASRNPAEANLVTFFRNEIEVGRGRWIGDGEFQVFQGRLPDGIYVQYHDNGRVQREYSFLRNHLHGLCRVFYDSGQLERQGTFVEGREEGISRLYYRNGRLKGESTYVAGLREGPTSLYFESGKPKAKLFFAKGLAHDLQQMFFENGELEMTVECKEGLRHGRIRQYFESGRLRMEGQFIRGNLHGEVVSYFESGRTRRTQNFHQGRILEESHQIARQRLKNESTHLAEAQE